MYSMIYPAPNSFLTINNILIPVNNSSFPPVFFKHACHVNSGADKKWAGSSLTHIL